MQNPSAPPVSLFELGALVRIFVPIHKHNSCIEDALFSRRKRDLFFDSSGSNSRWLLDRIVAARTAGYSTRLLWINVPVEIALLRNRDRAAESRRTMVPESVIIDKVDDIVASFETLRKEVDRAERIDNWKKEGDEL